MSGAIHSLPQYAFMEWCLGKNKHLHKSCTFSTIHHSTSFQYAEVSGPSVASTSQIRVSAMLLLLLA